MKKGLILAFVAVGFMVLFGLSTVASAKGQKSDFALFDGASTPTGAVCGAIPGKSAKIKEFTYYVATGNFGGSPAEFKVIYPDGDFVRYLVPAGESFSLSQAAGSGEFDSAIRVEAAAGLAGSASASGKNVFCISCDGDDAACDLIVEN
jgi:hypothetical protein